MEVSLDQTLGSQGICGIPQQAYKLHDWRVYSEILQVISFCSRQRLDRNA